MNLCRACRTVWLLPWSTVTPKSPLYRQLFLMVSVSAIPGQFQRRIAALHVTAKRQNLGVELMTPDRAALIEQVAKIIAGPDVHGQPDEETWRLWRTVAEQICALLLDTGSRDDTA